MRKIILLLTLSLVLTCGLKAQVVSTEFGLRTKEANAEWVNEKGTFKIFDLEKEKTRGVIRAKAGVVGVATYVGSYSGALSSTDVVYFKILRPVIRSKPIENVVVKYRQNNGPIETVILTLPKTRKVEEVMITPGFIEGATLSDLSFSFRKSNGKPAFDVLKPYKFVIGPNPKQSIKSK